MEVTLIPEPRDDVAAFRQILRNDDISFGERAYIRHGVGDGVTFLGEFVLNREVFMGALGVLGGWIAARQGRKVRVKFGDTEAEARTIKELEALLDLIDKRAASSDENSEPKD